MRNIEESILALLFSASLFLLILLSTVNLILNEEYLLGAFQRHDLYGQIPKVLSASLANDPNLTAEEKVTYSLIISSIPPAVTENIVNTNIRNVLSFVHGRAEKINIYFPAMDLGIGPENINWSSDRINIAVIKGIGQTLIYSSVVLLVLAVGFLYLFIRILKEKKYAGWLLVFTGSPLILIAIGLIFVVPQISKTFPQNIEPSQAILSVIFTSIFPEIGILWLIPGLILTLFGIIIVWRYKPAIIPDDGKTIGTSTQ